MNDPVNSPAHYTSHPSGVECIDYTERMGFVLGNAFKYIWRSGLKGDALEDLRKAQFYAKRYAQNPKRVRPSNLRVDLDTDLINPSASTHAFFALGEIWNTEIFGVGSDYEGRVLDYLDREIKSLEAGK